LRRHALFERRRHSFQLRIGQVEPNPRLLEAFFELRGSILRNQWDRDQTDKNQNQDGCPDALHVEISSYA
jgi:hypothetical protein